MNGIVGIIAFVCFIGLIVVLDKRMRKRDAERRASNKPNDTCCNVEEGCGRDDCD